MKGPKKVDTSKLWNSEKVEECRIRMANGESFRANYPFFEGDFRWKKKDLAFEYTDDELNEMRKCLDPDTGVRYFANKYCHVSSAKGRRVIELRGYQERILDTFVKENYVALLSPRQSGKSVVSLIYIVYCICFNTDFSVLIAADKLETAKDLIKKAKEILENLPFFMKPGVREKNVYQLAFDNECQIRGVATNENSGIGFATNLLYVDEYARIESSLASEFWKAVYPTLSANPDAKAIVTSTANGPNHFYDMFQGAKNNENRNQFHAIEIHWKDVPRGMPHEEFRQQEISNLGQGNLELGERLFDQEYGNRFFQDGRLLIGGRVLELLKKVEKNYVYVPIPVLEDKDLIYDELLWSPDYTDLLFGQYDKFVISIDLANGIGKDFTVFNIFKIAPLSLALIKRKARYDDVYDFFGLRQVGIYRCNTLSVNEVVPILEGIIFDVFGADNCRVVLEMNFKGEQVINKISEHDEYYDNIFLHTYYRSGSKILEPGVFLYRENKQFYCSELKKIMNERRMFFDEIESVREMKGFGLNRAGSYSCDAGHDDIAMTCVNLVPFMESEWFDELVEEVLPSVEKRLTDAMFDKLDNHESEPPSRFGPYEDGEEFINWSDL